MPSSTKKKTFPLFSVELFRRPIAKDVIAQTQVREEVFPKYDKLFPPQQEGVRFGVGLQGRCLIADDMGLGKTVQALAIMAHFRNDWPVLIVCPKVAVKVWRDEIIKWNLCSSEAKIQAITKGADQVEADVEFVISSIDTIKMATARHLMWFQYDGADETRNVPWKCVIIDECHKCKNPGSECSKAGQVLAERSTRLLLLSGTFILNKPEEGFVPIKMLLSGEAGKKVFGVSRDPTLKEYNLRYRKCEGKAGDLSKLAVTNEGAPPIVTRLQELNEVFKRVMIRRLKRDELPQLREKTRKKVNVPPEECDPKMLNELGADLMIMKQYSLTGQAKLPAARKWIKDYLENSSGRKSGEEPALLVFAHHTAVMDNLEFFVKEELKIGLIRIDGHVSVKQREQAVADFQENPQIRVGLLSITAAGQALTLTRAHAAVFVEIHWTPETMCQAEDRMYRIGQEKPVECFYLCGTDANMKDLDMFDRLETKKHETTAIMNGEATGMEFRSGLPNSGKATANGGLQNGPSQNAEILDEDVVLNGNSENDENSKLSIGSSHRRRKKGNMIANTSCGIPKGNYRVDYSSKVANYGEKTDSCEEESNTTKGNTTATSSSSENSASSTLSPPSRSSPESSDCTSDGGTGGCDSTALIAPNEFKKITFQRRQQEGIPPLKGNKESL